MAGIKKDYAGGIGSIHFPRKTKKGLRNKRKAHWAGVRRADLAEQERFEKRRQNANQFNYGSYDSDMY